MKDTSLKDARNKALYNLYKEGLEQGKFNSLEEACIQILNEKAPRYYISAKELSLHFGRIERGDMLLSLSANAMRRTYHLYEQYSTFKAAYPNCPLTRLQICEKLVDSPAPEFYISIHTVQKVLKKEIRKVRRMLC